MPDTGSNTPVPPGAMMMHLAENVGAATPDVGAGFKSPMRIPSSAPPLGARKLNPPAHVFPDEFMLSCE